MNPPPHAAGAHPLPTEHGPSAGPARCGLNSRSARDPFPADTGLHAQSEWQTGTGTEARRHRIVMQAIERAHLPENAGGRDSRLTDRQNPPA